MAEPGQIFINVKVNTDALKAELDLLRSSIRSLARVPVIVGDDRRLNIEIIKPTAEWRLSPEPIRTILLPQPRAQFLMTYCDACLHTRKDHVDDRRCQPSFGDCECDHMRRRIVPAPPGAWEIACSAAPGLLRRLEELR